MKATFALLALLLICLPAPARADDKFFVPEGVAYKKAPDDVNKQAMERLMAALDQQPHDFKGLLAQDEKAMTMAGMFYTIQTLEPHRKELSDLVKLNLTVPFGKLKTTVEGFAARGTHQAGELAAIMADTIHIAPGYKIRRATPEELATVWYYIGWDISEPFFVVADGKHKYAFNFEPSGKTLFWFDDLSKPCFTMGQSGTALTPCLCFVAERQGLEGNAVGVGFKKCTGKE